MVSTRSTAKGKTGTTTKAKTTPKAMPKIPTARKPNGGPKPKQSPPTDLPIHAFPDVSSFESFLDEHHTTLPGLWLKLARKSSKIPSIGTMEAVEIALCFGWINGQGKSFDENYYLARYTPRRPNSLWSELNVDLVSKLTDEGRMRPAGVAAVDAAKADGRWERAYARPRDMVVPEDFESVLGEGANEDAKEFFEGLGKGAKYNVLHRVYTASPKAREGRIRALVQGLKNGQVPGEKVK